MNDVVLAADLGGTNLRMAAVDDSGKILKRVKHPTPPSKSREDIVEAVRSSAKRLQAESQIKASAIALAVPGTISSESGLVTRAPNLPMLDDFDLAGAINGSCGMTVVIENDANAAALGENWLGASKDAETSIMVTLGTGVGGGIIINGDLLRGIDGTAGEIGHINVEPNGIECGCGSRGCLEQYSSASAVVRIANEAASKANSNEVLKKPIENSFQVWELATAGKNWAIESFEVQGFYLGIGLASLINIFNPNCIVIGGGAAGAWDFFWPAVANEVKERTYASAAARARIVPAALGDNAGILGAAKLGFIGGSSES